MSKDVLIVDDEAAIREVVGTILEDEGYRPRGAANSDEALREIERRVPGLVLLDIWLEGSALDGVQILERIKAAQLRDPGDHVQRPRHHRDRGRRDQEGRLRLHREAVQGRPPAAGDLSGRWRRASCGARVLELRNLAFDEAELIGNAPAMIRGPPGDRARGAYRLAHPDQRPARLRQGDGGAADPRQVAARQAPRSSSSTPRRWRRSGSMSSCSAPRPAWQSPDQPRLVGTARACRRRHAADRPGRRHAARVAGQDPARAAGAALLAAGRRQPGRGRRARDRLLQSRPEGRDGRRQVPRGSLLPAERGAAGDAAPGRAPDRHPRCWHGTSCSVAARALEPAAAADQRRCDGGDADHRMGRATCASCATRSSGC